MIFVSIRITKSTLEDIELKYHSALEQIAMLEAELAGNEDLEIQIQRLKDELRDTTEELSAAHRKIESLTSQVEHQLQTRTSKLNLSDKSPRSSKVSLPYGFHPQQIPEETVVKDSVPSSSRTSRASLPPLTSSRSLRKIHGMLDQMKMLESRVANFKSSLPLPVTPTTSSNSISSAINSPSHANSTVQFTPAHPSPSNNSKRSPNTPSHQRTLSSLNPTSSPSRQPSNPDLSPISKRHSSYSGSNLTSPPSSSGSSSVSSAIPVAKFRNSPSISNFSSAIDSHEMNNNNHNEFYENKYPKDEISQQSSNSLSRSKNLSKRASLINTDYHSYSSKAPPSPRKTPDEDHHSFQQPSNPSQQTRSKQSIPADRANSLRSGIPPLSNSRAPNSMETGKSNPDSFHNTQSKENLKSSRESVVSRRRSLMATRGELSAHEDPTRLSASPFNNPGPSSGEVYKQRSLNSLSSDYQHQQHMENFAKLSSNQLAGLKSFREYEQQASIHGNGFHHSATDFANENNKLQRRSMDVISSLSKKKPSTSNLNGNGVMYGHNHSYSNVSGLSTAQIANLYQQNNKNMGPPSQRQAFHTHHHSIGDFHSKNGSSRSVNEVGTSNNNNNNTPNFSQPDFHRRLYHQSSNISVGSASSNNAEERPGSAFSMLHGRPSVNNGHGRFA